MHLKQVQLHSHHVVPPASRWVSVWKSSGLSRGQAPRLGAFSGNYTQYTSRRETAISWVWDKVQCIHHNCRMLSPPLLCHVIVPNNRCSWWTAPQDELHQLPHNDLKTIAQTCHSCEKDGYCNTLLNPLLLNRFLWVEQQCVFMLCIYL